jgi:hypothetical protein
MIYAWQQKKQTKVRRKVAKVLCWPVSGLAEATLWRNSRKSDCIIIITTTTTTTTTAATAAAAANTTTTTTNHTTNSDMSLFYWLLAH